MVFKHEGKYKKFMGIAPIYSRDMFLFNVLVHFNKEKLDNVYKINHAKFLKKGGVEDISDVVGGLNEANPNIGDEIVTKIIEQFAKNIGWNLIPSIFTDAENESIADMVVKYENEYSHGWILNGK
jgi:lipoate-protein ligase A